MVVFPTCRVDLGADGTRGRWAGVSDLETEPASLEIRGKGNVTPQRESAFTTAVSMEMVSHSLANSDF